MMKDCRSFGLVKVQRFPQFFHLKFKEINFQQKFHFEYDYIKESCCHIRSTCGAFNVHMRGGTVVKLYRLLNSLGQLKKEIFFSFPKSLHPPSFLLRPTKYWRKARNTPEICKENDQMKNSFWGVTCTIEGIFFLNGWEASQSCKIFENCSTARKFEGVLQEKIGWIDWNAAPRSGKFRQPLGAIFQAPGVRISLHKLTLALKTLFTSRSSCL